MNVEMVFIFVFVIIVISFVLVATLNLFGRSTLQTCRSGLDAQTNSLRNDVLDIYTTAKDSTKSVTIPVDTSCVRKVCFFNPQDPGPNPSKGWEGNPTYEPVIENQGYSIGFIGNDNSFEGFVIDKLSPSESLCIESTEKLVLVNRGPSVDMEFSEE
ncbi:MAG: hypothetical protein HY512_02035 [Candidatus Aenigmarchaeota archaeon]|nr:hypothetical protein [Candidatus Aenigmarchaeota archaeon]